jgi:hypothetical protein
MLDTAEVLAHVDRLKSTNQEMAQDRERIRMIMNGGVDGIHAVMAWDFGKGASMKSRGEVAQAYGVDLPTVNLLASGLERSAQRIGAAPTLKPPNAEDPDHRAKLLKKVRIVTGWDEKDDVELHWPQIGRWLPGYGYALWKITQKRHSDGTPWPHAELRDPYNVYPGWFGASQQPSEAVTIRRVPLGTLQKVYPELNWTTIEGKLKTKAGITGREIPILGQTGVRTWEGPKTGVEVAEYMCGDGSYYVMPEVEESLVMIPNPLESGPAFVFMKRFSFDKLISQYAHVIGLMAMQAKLNIMGLIASEDSVFRETNIYGDLISGDYERGRKGINVFERDARVEKPTADVPQIMWQQVDRLERQLRIGANYDQTQDGISPQAFATGQATRELGNAATTNVSEYHRVIRRAAQKLDAKRLEWAERAWGAQRRRIWDMAGRRENYRPLTDIKGVYGTRRVYGAMAGWDDGAKAVVGLQYQSAGVLSVEAIQENVDNLEDANVINEQNRRKQAETTLFARLSVRAEQDPTADAALVEIMRDPSKQDEILAKYFTPQEPQVSPEEQQQLAAMAAGMGGGAPPLPPGAPRPPASTVLSQVDQQGAVKGGAQTVGRV